MQTYSFPTNMHFGVGSINKLPDVFATHGKKKVLIVTDPFLAKHTMTYQLESALNSAGISSSVFSEIDKNPIESNVIAGVVQFKSEFSDSIIGFGGGASMDVARTIAMKVNHDHPLQDFEDAKGGDRFITNEIPFFVTVPTTAGTGSEVGRSSVISEDKSHIKRIYFSPKLLAKHVFCDPELTLDLPPHITAATGMDALTHNIEAYLAKGYHPMADGIALEGIRLVSQNIVVATKNPTIEARTHMMSAAYMGAVAFQKGLGVVHSCAHALSTHKDLHHGLANAIMLPAGMEFNAAVSAPRMETIARYLQLKDTSAEGFIKWLRELNQTLEISGLREQGVGEADIDSLSKLAVQDVCHQCNEKPVTETDFKEIYQNSL